MEVKFAAQALSPWRASAVFIRPPCVVGVEITSPLDAALTVAVDPAAVRGTALWSVLNAMTRVDEQFRSVFLAILSFDVAHSCLF